jgi:DNA-binding beta-propeller fold protein YncE
VDIGTNPAHPSIVASLPLMNSVIGPPTNLAITPDGTLALAANSLDWVPDGANWKFVPDNKLYVIDLTTKPPSLIDTVAVGKQPSGLSINRAGNLALVANRADNSIGVLSIEGKRVRLIDTVPMQDLVAAVVFTPDGKQALAAKFTTHKVALLEVDGRKVTIGRQCRHRHGDRPRGESAPSDRQGRGGRRSRGFHNQSHRPNCYSSHSRRFGWSEEQLVLPSEWERRRARHRG